MSMTKQEIKREVNRLRKKADECEYYATTLTYEHQKSMKVELEAKAKELRELQKEYERLS
jgi:cell fate (sporulation/competence/biofilm development) regulator YmcA (YheA/YmcA/DUF963 family)